MPCNAFIYDPTQNPGQLENNLLIVNLVVGMTNLIYHIFQKIYYKNNKAVQEDISLKYKVVTFVSSRIRSSRKVAKQFQQ